MLQCIIVNYEIFVTFLIHCLTLSVMIIFIYTKSLKVSLGRSVKQIEQKRMPGTLGDRMKEQISFESFR